MSKFKILWIEDRPLKVGLEKDAVEEMIRMKGFTPIIEFISTQSELDNEEWKNRVKSREYDLLFIDFNLCNHMLGSKIISDIRQNNNIYVDIIFYSSDRDHLLEAVKSSFDGPLMGFIDDVHISILDDSEFNYKVEKVIDKIIGAWYNVQSIRGIILAKASKFETMISDIIRLYYEPQKEHLKNMLVEKRVKVTNQAKLTWDTMMDKEEPIIYVIEHPDRFNWQIRRMLFDELIEKSEISVGDENFSERLSSLFNTRNMFAHNKAKIIDGNLTLKIKNRDKIYKESDIASIRENINYIEEVLIKLLENK